MLMNHPNNTTRSIFLLDDHPVVRDGLRAVLDVSGRYHVCGEATTPAQAVRHLSRAHADCVIVDLMFRHSKRLDVIASIRRACPDLPIVVLSMLDRSACEREVRAAGASAYIEKHEAPHKLLSTLDRLLPTGLGHPATPSPSLSKLTPRERTIFDSLGRGLDKHHIAADLGIHVKTIETHREALKSKLGIRSCRELVRMAVHVRSGN
jgi:DNA-binding NarL/FixJ family response regulator